MDYMCVCVCVRSKHNGWVGMKRWDKMWLFRRGWLRRKRVKGEQLWTKWWNMSKTNDNCDMTRQMLLSQTRIRYIQSEFTFQSYFDCSKRKKWQINQLRVSKHELRLVSSVRIDTNDANLNISSFDFNRRVCGTHTHRNNCLNEIDWYRSRA